MIRWLRVVWPPWWAVLLSVAICAGFHGAMLYIYWLLGEQFLSAQDERPLLVVTIIFACLYALYRVGVCHPAVRPDYCQWLRGTPWTVRKRLPLGPVHLVGQDVLMLSVAVGLGWPTLHSHSLVTVSGFSFCYLIAVGVLNFATGAKRWAYALGFGIGFMVLSVHNYPMFGVAALVCYGIAYLGLQAALARFPWDDSVVRQILNNKELGWPYGPLGPPGLPDLPPIAWTDALGIGALAGWWFFAVINSLHLSPQEEPEIIMVFLVLPMGVLARLLFYCYGYLPPISLMGRLAHGRWIIPGYDQVFVAPLLVLLVVMVACFVPVWTGLDRLIVTSVAIALTIWILLGMGPNLRAWRLTGNHRISPGLLTRQFTR